MSLYFNPEMIRIGRDSRGFTQKELAAKIGVSQPMISKFESGELRLDMNEVQRIAEELEYPFQFFMLPEKRLIYQGTGVFHRHRSSKVTDREMDQLHGKLNILRIQLKRLLHYAHMDADYAVPRLDLRDFGNDPTAVARKVREQWSIAAGPIPEMMETLEAAGIIIIMSVLECADVSAVSQYVPESGVPPIIYLNEGMPTDHQRFTLAHELGHIVMHHIPTDAPEDEANLFAQEFLMPEKDIARHLQGVALPMLLRLKPYWRVSIAALIQRACTLGKITVARKGELHRQLNAKGMRRNEPLPLAPEEPTILSDIFHVCASDHGFSLQELSQIMLMQPGELQWVYGGLQEFRDEPGQESSSIRSLTDFLSSIPEHEQGRIADIMSAYQGRLSTK